MAYSFLFCTVYRINKLLAAGNRVSTDFRT
jgi:hypothetical protein